MDLLNLLKGQMGSALIQEAGKFLGESESNTQKAFDSALPAILGGLASKATNTTGAEGILGMITKGGFDGSMLGNLAGLFGGGSRTNTLMSTGVGLISSLFGSRVGAVANLISSVAGIGNKSSNNLLGMLMPVVLSMLGKARKDNNLDAGGIANLLLGQKGALKNAAPAGLAGALGLGSFDDLPDSVNFANLGSNLGGNVKSVAGDVKSGVSNTVSGGVDVGKKAVSGTVGAAGDAAAAGGGLLKKLLPLLLIGLIGIGAFIGFRSCSGDAADMAKNATNKVANTTKNVGAAATDMTKKAVDATGDAAKGVGDAAKNAVKKGADFFKFAAGSTEAKFADFLNSGTGNGAFVLDKVEFDTGSSNLRPSSQAQLNNMVKVLGAYKNVHVEVQGHTDNVGSAAGNTALSQKRADSVMKFLAGKGVGAGRMSAKGYGPDKPRASNDTAEGKQKNRRVELKVTKK